MKKTILTLLFLALAVYAGAQEKSSETAYKREGKTFVQSNSQVLRGDTITTYIWRDKQGKEYPIILHRYTKGDKAGRTTAYVIRTSEKSGKEYRYFLPDGEQIAKDILTESK